MASILKALQAEQSRLAKQAEALADAAEALDGAIAALADLTNGASAPPAPKVKREAEPTLTEYQRKVYNLAKSGKSPKWIASKLKRKRHNIDQVLSTLRHDKGLKV